MFQLFSVSSGGGMFMSSFHHIKNLLLLIRMLKDEEMRFVTIYLTFKRKMLSYHNGNSEMT